MREEHPCPVCKATCTYTQLHDQLPDGSRFYPCPRCRAFLLTKDAEDILPAVLKGRADAGAILSHFISRIRRPALDRTIVDAPTITPEFLERVVEAERLPDPLEQVDNLILWLGEASRPDRLVHISEDLQSIIGGLSQEAVGWVRDYLVEEGLVTAPRNRTVALPGGGSVTSATYTLSYKGWERYRNLQSLGALSRLAFMAMPFRFPDLIDMFRKHLKPAVGQTGYDLRLITDGATAGSIDNRLRVEIRRSRFVVCELTEGNQGAYWEAGYAEGLGRPVFYTCRKDLVDGHSVHFDTRQQNITTWEVGKQSDAMERLKATIRVTIPEAKQADS